MRLTKLTNFWGKLQLPPLVPGRRLLFTRNQFKRLGKAFTNFDAICLHTNEEKFQLKFASAARFEIRKLNDVSFPQPTATGFAKASGVCESNAGREQALLMIKTSISPYDLESTDTHTKVEKIFFVFLENRVVFSSLTSFLEQIFPSFCLTSEATQFTEQRKSFCEKVEAFSTATICKKAHDFSYLLIRNVEISEI